jgi:hypothetical protein
MKKTKCILFFVVLVAVAFSLGIVSFSPQVKAAGNVTVSQYGLSMANYYYAWGEVTNVGDTPVTNILVTANFYDASNNFINSSKTTIGPYLGAQGINNSFVLMPGAKAPLTLIQLAPSSGAQNVNHYTVTVSFEECAPVTEGLQITLDNVTYYSAIHTLYLHGTVKNTGANKTDGIDIFATAYASNGSEIDTEEWGPAESTALNPNEAKSFSVSLQSYAIPNIDVASYRLTAQSWVYSDVTLLPVGQYILASDITNVVPEFPSVLILLLLITAMTAVLALCKKRQP